MRNRNALTINKIFVSFLISICCFKADYTSLSAQRKTEISWKIVDTISIPIPPPEHPRLYLRSVHAEETGVRLKDPVLQPVVNRLRSRSARSLQSKVEWDAVQYLVSKDKVLGRLTIDSTLALLKRTKFPEIPMSERVTGRDSIISLIAFNMRASRVAGRMMVTGALVYDWLYSLLSPADKNAFIQELIRLAKTLECGYPPTNPLQGSMTGHTAESIIMRDMLSAGIAIYDEYPDMYEHAAVRFFREHLPARNWFYNGHAYHQGDSYGPYRYSWETYPLMIYDRMGVDNIYNPEQQYVPYFYIYTTRPDGQRMRGGNTYLTSLARGVPWPMEGTLFTASYYGDGILLDQFLRQGGGDENIFQFLWWGTNLKPIPVSTLPLSRYFGHPFGWMVARTGWNDKAAIAEMKINEYYFNNHQHMDAGAFQIYYRGPLATESGLYQGTDGTYLSQHNINYYWRTIAHNTLLIYDPSEHFSSRGNYSNDGGQRWPNNRREPLTLEVLLNPSNTYRTGEVLSHGFGPSVQTPDYTYLKGDITKAYGSKVSEVKRSFVFLNLKNEQVPAALIVYDKVVSSDPLFKKYWLLHSIEAPVIHGNQVTITRTMDGETGKLVNISLIPGIDNTELTPVGGPGKEFWVFGKNYENEPYYTREHSYERAAWRIELSPGKPAQKDYFLNIMQVMESNVNNFDVNKMVGDKVVGVHISNRLVLFSKDLNTISSTFTFSVNEVGSIKILITDLMPGTWQVLKDNKIVIPSTTVKEEDGVLYIEGTRGVYKMLRL